MKENLENSIQLVKQRPTPECPANLEANVLRRVRTASDTEAEENFIGWITGLIPKTSFALSSIALVIAVSTVTTMTTAWILTADRKSEINRALGFDTITATQIVHLERH